MVPFARLADPAMLSISNLDYDSPATVLFQRASVSVTGLLLAAAAFRATRGAAGGGGGKLRGQLLFFLLVANSGLLLVDNIHFQYNGILMGASRWLGCCYAPVLGRWTVGHQLRHLPPSPRTNHPTKTKTRPGLMVLSLLLADEGAFVSSGVLFAVLLNMKHLFAYMAPVYFVFLLRQYCMGGGTTTAATTTKISSSSSSSSKQISGSPNHTAPVSLTVFLTRLTKLGAAVLAVFALSLGPFLRMGQLGQLLTRLFPFGRGLCHAYWAPNFWALYSFGDKVLAATLSRAGLVAPPGVGHMAGGIVGVSKFAVLPQVGSFGKGRPRGGFW
jgi:alpha-1,3-glucosyltransferase